MGLAAITLPEAAVIGGGLGAVGGIASAAIGGSAAESAASTQAAAATQAEQQQLALYNETQQNVQPFITAGEGAIPQLQQYAAAGSGVQGSARPRRRDGTPVRAASAACRGRGRRTRTT